MTAVPGRCRFNDQGWLTGPITITHVLTPNRYDTGFGDGRGVVLHTEAGFEAGTVATFMNPVNQVSAFFSVGQSGAVTQYVPVGRGMAAWSQGNGNLLWRGIETEDRTDPAVPLTAAQLAAVAQITEACSAFDGFPLQVTDDPLSGRGLITHGDGGVGWGGHFGCPGDVRKAQRPAIITLAKQIREGTPATTATPEDPMLLNRGAGAITPLAIPGNCTSVRFYAAAPADLTWTLAGGKPQGLKLTAASSQMVSLPSGHHALAVTRVDAGTGDVSAVGQP